MFGFIKDKLKKVVSDFSSKLAKEAEEPAEKIEEKKPEIKKAEEKPKIKEEKKEKKTEPKKPEAKKTIEEEKKPEIKKAEEKLPETQKEEPKAQKGFFGKIKEKFEHKEEAVAEKPKIEAEDKKFFEKITEKITKKTITDKKFDELFDEFELMLLENNVALEVIDKIKQDMKERLVNVPIDRDVEKVINESLKGSVESLFEVKARDIVAMAHEKKPFVIVFVGINGSGKTTTIAKIAKLMQDNKLRCVMAAGDTFRAAAIQQLEEHGSKLGIKVIKQDYGSDSAAVAFDAVKYAEAHAIDVVLVDTAGRLHSNTNLMDELKKVIRVVKPDLKLFIGESITGNDCVEQAKKFDEAVGIDGIILSKADVDEKGGAAISVSYITKKPILYLGTGQNYSDLTPFDSSLVISGLGLA